MKLVSGLRDAGPVALAGFAVNGANVVVTVLIARMLATRGYGTVAQMTSLFLVISMPGTAVAIGVVRRVTRLVTDRQRQDVSVWASSIHSTATLLLVVLVVILFLTKDLFARMLSIPTSVGVFAVVVGGLVWILLSLDRGLLQADRAYRALSVNMAIEGGVRTVSVLCLVAVGLGAEGAALGILISEVVTAAHARREADRAWRGIQDRGPLALGASTVLSLVSGMSRGESRSDGHPRRPGVRAVVAYARSHFKRISLDVGGALLAVALLAYLQNVDMIVLGRESHGNSGPYAAISVASKALVFAAIALGGYLLPESAIARSRGGHALRQLGVTMLVLAVPGTVLLTGASLFPTRLLSIFFSSRYESAHLAFWLLVLAMMCLSTTVVFTTYLLGAGQRWVGVLLLVGAVVATAAIAGAHGAPRPTASADLLVQAGLTVVVAVGLVVVHMKSARVCDVPVALARIKQALPAGRERVMTDFAMSVRPQPGRASSVVEISRPDRGTISLSKIEGSPIFPGLGEEPG
jgi:O-antigen/teichoic acid export membrane protein